MLRRDRSVSWLTPMTNVTSGFFAGAVMIDALGAGRDVLGRVLAIGEPAGAFEDDSTPRSFQGSCAGSFCASTWNSSPSTVMRSPAALMSALRLPRIESYFSRCASVAASVRSLTATMSMSSCGIAARMMLRPIRPKPLMPTLMAMRMPPPGTASRARTLNSTKTSRHGRGRPRSRRCAIPRKRVSSADVHALYTLAIVLLAVVLSPWFVYQAVRYRKYIGSLASGWAICRSASTSTATSRSGFTPSRSARR